MAEDEYRLIGIGNALSDIVVDVQDDFLQSYDLVKGSMMLTDESILTNMRERLSIAEEHIFPGGSCGNTIAVFANLGGKGGFIGKVANDEYGRMYRASLEECGVEFLCPLVEGEVSGSCVVMVTPDAQRTMATALCIAEHLQVSDIDENLIKKASGLYLEGYLYDKEEAKDAFEKAASIGRANGAEISLSLSDVFCVQRHYDDFHRLVEQSCDILFANEQEIFTLYGTQSREDAIAHMQSLNKIVCLTLGGDGACITKGNEKYMIPAYELGKAIDSTGAGDCFAAGFLYGYHHELSLEQAGHLGSLLAGDVITHHGPRSLNNTRALIEKHLGFSVPS